MFEVIKLLSKSDKLSLWEVDGRIKDSLSYDGPALVACYFGFYANWLVV